MPTESTVSSTAPFATKVEHYNDPAMAETAPLLMATPLYGAQAETVTFDEEVIQSGATVTADVLTANGNAIDSYYQDNNDPLAIRAVPSTDYSFAHSEKMEEPAYRDTPFAILFWLQLISVFVMGYFVAPRGYEMINMSDIHEAMEKDPTTTSSDIADFEIFVTFVAQYARVYPERIFFYLLSTAALAAFLMALVVTAKIIRQHAKFMVTFCVVGAFVDTAIAMFFFVVGSGSVISLLFAIGVLSVVAYYIRIAWRLIPHSAVNLSVALDGIQSNCGIYIVTFFLAELGFAWAAYWFYVMIGSMAYVGETKCPGMTDDEECPPQGWTFLFLLLCFYWTIQVITNTIQVTVAGVMATWCYDYDSARNCCSSAVWSSLYRSLTFSFGSICFGSLLLGIVRVLQYCIQNAKRQRDNRSDNCEGAEMLLCVLDCLINFFEEVLEYFNHWAYVFCAIYGESYLESGKMVVELFRARGWSTIVTDDLIGYVLAFTTFSVGIFTGLFSLCVERVLDSLIPPDPVDPSLKTTLEFWDSNTSFLFGPLPNPPAIAFCLGFVQGLIVCSIMMSVVRGAVNTLIVCWADSPARLEENHPEATKEMAEAWSSAFPEARVQISQPPLLQPA